MSNLHAAMPQDHSCVAILFIPPFLVADFIYLAIMELPFFGYRVVYLDDFIILDENYFFAEVSEMSSRLTSESRIYADKAKDLNRQVSLVG